MDTKSQVKTGHIYLTYAGGPPEFPARPAVPAEVERMSPHVFWFYQRGQPVALWICSSRISLAPLTLPGGQVILLQRHTS